MKKALSDAFVKIHKKSAIFCKVNNPHLYLPNVSLCIPKRAVETGLIYAKKERGSICRITTGGICKIRNLTRIIIEFYLEKQLKGLQQDPWHQIDIPGLKVMLDW